jgi:hypothetical protein
MEVWVNRWEGNELGFGDRIVYCDICGKPGTVWLIPDHLCVCLRCLITAQKAIEAAALEEVAE